MARLRGWSLRGRRRLCKVPHGQRQTSTFIAALRRNRIDAPFLIEGSANMDVFKAYVEKILCPELAPGDVVILDNLCIHKTPPHVERLILERGATLRFLPPYSPDLNPIELAFSKLKGHLRERAARTLDALEDAIRDTASPSSIPFTAEASFGMPNTGLTNSKMLRSSPFLD
jgi:transposase